MPPRDPKPAISRRKSKLNLDMPEPELTRMLHQYCDLRRRGFSQTKLQPKRHQPSLLLAEAARRGMAGSQENQTDAVAEWLLTMFDASVEIGTIQRMSALTDRGIKQRLKRALDTTSGNPPNGLIIPGPDGTPGRVSWLTPSGRLMHRPFDGAFPARYPAEAAQEQCRDVFIQLLDHPEGSARKRAYTMLTMANAGLHTFGHEVGRELNAVLAEAGMDEDAKHTVILNLHDHPHVQQLLLQ